MVKRWALSINDDQWWSIQATGPLIELPDGTPFLEWTELQWSRVEPGDPNDDIEIQDVLVGPIVRLRIAVHDGRPELDGLIVDRREGEEITSALLDGLPLREMVGGFVSRIAVLAAVNAQRSTGQWPADQGEFDSFRDSAVSAASAARRRRVITDELLREVAEVYKANLATGHPTKAVQEHFGRTYRMAGVYVAAARKAKYLPKAPKKGTNK
jgi:hypothetical protein